MASSPITRTLYRSLLRTSKPFSRGSPDAAALTCLLHRTGIEDEKWSSFLREHREEKTEPDKKSEHAYRFLFNKLLREVVSGDPNGSRQMIFPGTMQVNGLKEVIRREFRDDDSISAEFDEDIRREVAFRALRELHKKLAWAEQLRKTAPTIHPQQAALYVTALPTTPPSSYLRPGAYLIAHPLLSGYFRRSVILLLDHSGTYGTYGLVVNRLCRSPRSGESLTMQDVLRPVPPDLESAFGSQYVKDGGPVNISLQMIHCSKMEREELTIGGHQLSMIPEEGQRSSTTLDEDRGIYYKGDYMKAASAVISGKLDREDVSFFVGASSWVPGQLQSEIERGYWLPCRGPTQIAHLGICEHASTPEGEPLPNADLWLSMLSACGEEEAELAHLIFRDDGDNDLGASCDDDYS